MNAEKFRELALSFPGVIEAVHFDKAAFKVTGKRIFATLHEPSEVANLKLPPEDQATFCAIDASAIYAVPNKWGLQGWTTFEVSRVPEGLLLDAVSTAYNDVFKPQKDKPLKLK